MQYDDFTVPETGHTCEEYYGEGECIADYPDVDASDVLDALMHDAPEWWLRRAEEIQPCCDRWGEAGADTGDLADAPEDCEDRTPF